MGYGSLPPLGLPGSSLCTGKHAPLMNQIANPIVRLKVYTLIILCQKFQPNSSKG
jgi:hypothetical protein